MRRYVEILETIYLVRTIPAWSGNATTRAVGTPKVFFVDSGLAGHLGAGVGALVETFVFGEIARQLTWSETFASLYHYRGRDQYEVDAALEDNTGRVVGLRLLQRRLGERFHAGFVLYGGTESLSFGKGLTCLPISALWTTSPQS